MIDTIENWQYYNQFVARLLSLVTSSRFKDSQMQIIFVSGVFSVLQTNLQTHLYWLHFLQIFIVGHV